MGGGSGGLGGVVCCSGSFGFVCDVKNDNEWIGKSNSHSFCALRNIRTYM